MHRARSFSRLPCGRVTNARLSPLTPAHARAAEVVIHSRSMLPEPGQIVRVRSRQYLVEEVTPSVREGLDSRVRMSCLDDDAQGQKL